MKRILSYITLLLVAGCSQSYVDEAVVSNVAEEFYATIEGSSDTDQTRTYVDGNITTRWHSDDCLTIFKKEIYNREYKFNGRTGDNAGGFVQVSVDDEFRASETLDYNYAVYPHSDNNRFIKETESFEITMPAEQTYAENSFGRGANTMVAVSESGQLLFKNVGSFLRVRLWGENTAVSSITITPNGDEVIAGDAQVKLSLGGDPTCVMTGSVKSVTLNCPEPVTISESENTPTDFWIVLPTVTFERGFTVTVKNSQDQVQTYEVNASCTFARNKYYDFQREVVLGQTTDPSAEVPSNQIWYTSSDGEIVTPNITNVFGANIISNVYENGKGVIVFDGNITSIGDSAFYGCRSLTSITIPDSVTSIGMYAFQWCESLTSITIPDSVTSIEGSIFYGCNNLTSFYGKFASADNRCFIINGVLHSFAPAGLTTYTISDSVTEIRNYAFSGCSNLTNITIPDSVTEIGNEAFSGCSSLTGFYGKFASADNRCLIIDGVLHCFARAGLTTYTIPNSVTEIGNYAFYGCFNLTSINIPNSVTEIGNEAFGGCSNLTSVTIPNSVTSIENGAFQYCERLENVTIGNNITSIGEKAFYYCFSLTSITIPDSVTSIGENAFFNCTSLTSATIGNSVTEIGYGAFSSCPLISITIPNSVTEIGNYAFAYCYHLTSINIPDSVTEIGYGTFISCSLTSITIPDSITSIGEYAFYNCSSLTSVYCKPTTPPTGGKHMFNTNASGSKIYVPTESVDTYKTASYWSDYSSDIEGYNF